MRQDRTAWGVALVVVLAACNKEPPEQDPGSPAAPATGVPAVEEEGPAEAAPPAARKAAPAPSQDENASKPIALATTGRAPETEASPPAQPTPTPAAPPSPPPAPPAPPKSEVKTSPPDLRLLLTAADVSEVAGPKIEFQRTVLPGFEPGDDRQALYFEPVKGGGFGFAIQVFRARDAQAARQRFEQAFATYPNAVEVAPVAGSSFFAYWGEVLHVGFLQPHGNLVVIVSCGRTICDSDALYALAKKANSRIR